MVQLGYFCLFLGITYNVPVLLQFDGICIYKTERIIRELSLKQTPLSQAFDPAVYNYPNLFKNLDT